MELSKKIKTLAKVFLASVLFAILISTAQIKVGLLPSLIQKPWLLAEVTTLFGAITLVGAWRWHALNSAQGIHFTLSKTILITYIGCAFNNLLPSSVGGDAFKIFYVFKQYPQNKSRIVLTIFTDRLLGFLSVLLILCVGALFYIPQLHQQRRIFYLFAACAAVSFAILGIFLIFLWFSRKMKANQSMTKWLGHNKVSQKITVFLEAMSTFRYEKSVIIKGLLFSICIQILMTLVVLLIAKTMSLPLTFPGYLVAIGITQIVSLFPITPGGIGIGEMAFANVLLLLNPFSSAPYATAFFAYRLFGQLAYLPGLIYGIPEFFKKRGIKGSVESEYV